MTPTAHQQAFAAHRLHDLERSWPETNCYVDLWIELLASMGETPEAALGFTVLQDLEPDQFTFFKLPIEDLRRLYGLTVQELSIYRTMEQHASLHVGRGHIVLIEVDAFWLPDTAATTYRRVHAKTTIAVDSIDRVRGECAYLHNAARNVLVGEDYRGAFRLGADFASRPDLLPLYVEIVGRCPRGRDLGAAREVALDILRGHLSRRPRRNPFAAWREAFADQVDGVLSAPETFEDYAFHFPRLAGSNFELLGSHAAWLAADELDDVRQACQRLAETTKILQFRLARSVARQRLDLCPECFDTLEAEYEQAMSGLDRWTSACPT